MKYMYKVRNKKNKKFVINFLNVPLQVMFVFNSLVTHCAGRNMVKWLNICYTGDTQSRNSVWSAPARIETNGWDYFRLTGGT